MAVANLPLASMPKTRMHWHQTRQVAAPLMVVALVIGLVVSLLQALNQIQEQTIVYVPKILAVFATLLLMLPVMGDAASAEPDQPWVPFPRLRLAGDDTGAWAFQHALGSRSAGFPSPPPLRGSGRGRHATCYPRRA